jgi:hypothetical protein
MVDAHNCLSLEKAYKAVYEEVRTTYPKLALVELDGMLTKYCQLLKAWVASDISYVSFFLGAGGPTGKH